MTTRRAKRDTEKRPPTAVGNDGGTTSTGSRPKLIRGPLREQVKDLILQRILKGEYPPGSRLVETRIAGELEISQGTVREALRDLEQLGCVVHQPNRGCSVRAFSVDELLAALPVRAALESLAAELAAELITEGELERLRQLIEEMHGAARQDDRHEHARANSEFHATIVHAARNAIVERQWRFLEPFSRTYISISREDLDLHELADRHLPLLEALEDHDGSAAVTAVKQHLDDVVELLRSLADERSLEAIVDEQPLDRGEQPE